MLQRVQIRLAGAVTLAFALAACATVPRAPQPPAVPVAAPVQPTASPAVVAPNLPAPPAASNGAALTNGAAAAAAAATTAAAARPPDPAAPKPFAELTKGAKEYGGFFSLWQKDDKIWLEIRNDQLDNPFFFAHSRASGIGDRFLFPGLMGQEHIAEFRRAGNTVQFLAKNLRARARAGTPLEIALRESYSDSLLTSVPVASAIHPERKSFLVDATLLFASDIPGTQTFLETAFRLPYAQDPRNTSIERFRTTDAATNVTVRAHFSMSKLPAPPLVAPAAAQPSPPRTLADVRSMFISTTYSMAPLPAEPMRPRLADQRVGHFTTSFFDLSKDGLADVRTHFVERWRLEKRDPAAALSEPKEPITVWLDKNIPDKWRDSVRAGVMEWNKAFERAGFKDALAVKQQPADADWSTLDGTRHLAVRWFSMHGPGAAAIGPSQSDPRSGEILRGAALIPDNWTRFSRTAIAETLPRAPAHEGHSHDEHCTYAHDAMEHNAFGFEMLVARGAIDPDGADAERFINAGLKDVVMHEVGHALGLRHNFKGSSGVQLNKLRDATYARSSGISNSVMDYNALNIPLDNEPATEYHQATLGAYDYWAIEYAYKPLAPDHESQELAALAARSATDPKLAYASDEDAGGSGDLTGIDPTVNRFDLGDDPLGYYKRRFALSRELWTRTQARELKSGDSYSIYRRNLLRGLGQIGAVAPLIVKYVGGVYTTRDLAGNHRPLLAPVPAAKQREALDLLAKQLFNADSFRFDPKYMSRLGVDHLDRYASSDFASVINTDFSLAGNVLGMQRGALVTLMSESVAVRLADAEAKTANGTELLTYADVQSQLTDAIWSELKGRGDIGSLRRNLQREHVKLVATSLVRPTSAAAADVRSVQRQVAIRLQADLRRALAANGKLSPVARAHLDESLTTIGEALKAPLIKQGA